MSTDPLIYCVFLQNQSNSNFLKKLVGPSRYGSPKRAPLIALIMLDE